MLEKNFAADFRAEKSQEGLRRKTNDRRRPVNLGPRILKIVVFGARRRFLHPHFELGIGSNANVFYFLICCVTSDVTLVSVFIEETKGPKHNKTRLVQGSPPK